MTTNRVCLVAFFLAIVPLLAQAASTCSEPPTGLVSWWPGDANENDLVLGLNNPSVVNEVSLVPGEVLNGFTFGTDGYIEIPPSSSLANQKFSWAAWVNPQGAYGDQYGSVIVVQNSDTQSDIVALDWRNSPDSRFVFGFGNQNNEIIYSKDTFPANSFYHVAATYDGTTFRLYVNGVLEGSFKERKTIAYTTYPWGIGESFILGIGSGFREWIGVIDEVQAFNRALSASELLTIYKAGTHGECKGLLMNPTRLTFARQLVGTTSAAQTVTATNLTSSPISLTSIGFTGIDKGDFGETNTCGGSVPVGGSCTFSITFTPSATGSRSASMAVKDTASGSPQRVSASGTGE
jgi:hypothetical protein